MTSSLFLQADPDFACELRREQVIACADQIPPLPHAVLKVLKLLDDPDTDASQLVEAFSSNAGLASALVKLANSAAFASAGSVVSIEQAVTTVGFAKLRPLVLATALRGMKKNDAVDHLIWDNSLATAIIGRELAESVKPSWADEIFLMGLLHGLGQLAMLAAPATREMYSQVLLRIRETGVDYVAAETTEIGFSHPVIGALVANRWNFPREVCQTILHYTNPLEGFETPEDQKLAFVKLADLLAHKAGLGSPEGFPVDSETIQQLSTALGIFRPEGEIVTVLIEEAQNQFQAEAKTWSV